MQRFLLFLVFSIKIFISYGCLPSPVVEVAPTITITTTTAFTITCPCTIPVVGPTIDQTPNVVDANGCPLDIQLTCMVGNVQLNMDTFGPSRGITCDPASGRFVYLDGLTGMNILINSIGCM